MSNRYSVLPRTEVEALIKINNQIRRKLQSGMDKALAKRNDYDRERRRLLNDLKVLEGDNSDNEEVMDQYRDTFAKLDDDNRDLEDS